MLRSLSSRSWVKETLTTRAIRLSTAVAHVYLQENWQISQPEPTRVGERKHGPVMPESFEGPQEGRPPGWGRALAPPNPVGLHVHEPHPCLEPRQDPSCVDIQSALLAESFRTSIYSSWHGTRRPLSTRPPRGQLLDKEKVRPRAASQVPGRVGGHSSPLRAQCGPMAAAGPGPAVMAEVSSSGDSVPWC